MLSFFRRGGGGQWLVGSLVLAIAVVFVLGFRPGQGATGASMASDCAVEVKGRCVPLKEYNAAYGLSAPPYAQPKQIRQLELNKRVAEGLVQRELLLAEAQRLGISVSDDAINREMAEGRARLSLPVSDAEWLSAMLGLCQRDFLTQGCAPGTEMVRLLPVRSTKTGKFDLEIYERNVRHIANRSPREFREMQERELTASRMREIITSSVQVSEDEAFLQYSLARSTASLDELMLDREWYARHVINPTPEVVAEWSKAHAKEIATGWESLQSDWVEGCSLVVDARVSWGPEATDDTKATLRQKLDGAAKLAAGGADFEAVARAVGAQADPPGTELRCLALDAPEELKAAVAAMQPGSVSPLIETPSGLHLLKYIGPMPAGQASAVGREAVTKRLALSFLTEEGLKAAANRVQELVKGGKSLKAATQILLDELLGEEPAARVVGLTTGGENPLRALALADDRRPAVESVGPFNALSSPLPEAVPGQASARDLFDLEVGEVQQVAMLKGVAVVQLKDKTSAARADFEKDKDLIMRRLRQVKRQDALVAYVERLREDAKDEIRISAELLASKKGEQQSDG